MSLKETFKPVENFYKSLLEPIKEASKEDYRKVGGSKVLDSQHTMCFLEGVHTFQGSGRVFLLALQKWVHTGSQEQWTGLV